MKGTPRRQKNRVEMEDGVVESGNFDIPQSLELSAILVSLMIGTLHLLVGLERRRKINQIATPRYVLS